MSRAARTLVVVPTLEERANVGVLVPKLLALDPPVELLVVDDASADGTAEAVRAFAAEDARVHLLARPGRLGMGTAYRDGFRWALERGYDVVVQMDADLSHDPADVPRLVAELADADVALGSRFTPGGRCVDWPWGRQLLSRVSSAYVRPVLGLAVADPMGGFKAYRRATLERIHVERLRARGFAFQAEILHLAVRAGLVVREVPITFRDRDQGRSKMSLAIVREAIVHPWRIRRDAGVAP